MKISKNAKGIRAGDAPFGDRSARGFTLIEVLIALAVLSIGLAGMAAMQLSSLQHNHSAHYRSLATTIALDFEERLWIELADNALAGCPNTADDSTAGSPAAELIADWARYSAGGEGEADWNWSNANMLRIPNLQIDVGAAVTAGSVTQIPVTFSWAESRFTDTEAGAEGIESFTYNVRILCRPVA